MRAPRRNRYPPAREGQRRRAGWLREPLPHSEAHKRRSSSGRVLRDCFDTRRNIAQKAGSHRSRLLAPNHRSQPCLRRPRPRRFAHDAQRCRPDAAALVHYASSPQHRAKNQSYARGVRVCACPVSPMAAPLLLVSSTPPIATDPFHPARRSGIAAHGSVDKMDVIAAGRGGDEAGHQCRCLAVSSLSEPLLLLLPASDSSFQLVRNLRGAVERHPQAVVELAKVRVRHELPPIPSRVKATNPQARIGR